MHPYEFREDSTIVPAHPEGIVSDWIPSLLGWIHPIRASLHGQSEAQTPVCLKPSLPTAGE